MVGTKYDMHNGTAINHKYGFERSTTFHANCEKRGVQKKPLLNF